MLLLTTSIVVMASPASASNLNLNFSSLSFSPEADLVSASSNLGPGFSRRYENVATIDGVVVDALVTIVSQSGNVNNELDTFDEYDNTQHLSAHTKPSGTAEASGKIKVEFVADGTSTPVVINNVRASIADIDAHEFGTFYGITSYRLSSDTQLSRSGTTAGVYRFHSSTTGASSTDEKRLVEVDYGSTSSVTSEFGCRQNASSSIGAGGKCGFTVVIGTFTRATSAVETAVNRPTYTISYNANNGTSGTVPASTTGTSAVTISDNTGSLLQSTDVFLGWNTLPNGTGVSFPPGTSFVPSEDMVLFAQYGPAPITTTPTTTPGTTPTTTPTTTAAPTESTLTGTVAPTENPTTTTTPPQIEKSGDLPKTGLSPNMLIGQLGVWILVAGAIVWRLSALRRRRPYQPPRWLNEIDGE